MLVLFYKWGREPHRMIITSLQAST
jgi:hypothetical protein